MPDPRTPMASGRGVPRPYESTLSIDQRLASLRDEIAAIEQAIKAYSQAHDQLAKLQSEIQTLSRQADAPSPRPARAPAAEALAVPTRRGSTNSSSFVVALLTLAGVWLLVGLHVALLLTLRPPLQPQPAVATLVAPDPSPTVVPPTQTPVGPTPNPAAPTAAPSPPPAEPPEPEAPFPAPNIEPAIGVAVIRPPPGFAAARVRERPSTSARILRTLPTGSRVELLQGSARAGFLWLRVRTVEGEIGWVVSTALQRVG